MFWFCDCCFEGVCCVSFVYFVCVWICVVWYGVDVWVEYDLFGFVFDLLGLLCWVGVVWWCCVGICVLYGVCGCGYYCVGDDCVVCVWCVVCCWCVVFGVFGVVGVEVGWVFCVLGLVVVVW